MWQRASRAAFAAAFLLASVANALPHGDDEAMDMDMGMDMSHSESTHESSTEADDDSPMSYFAYGKHGTAIAVHIGLMILAWCFILPTGIAHSNLFSTKAPKTNTCNNSGHVQHRTVTFRIAVAIPFLGMQRGGIAYWNHLQQPDPRFV